VAIARVDHVDEEVLAWMRKAGCNQISYGIESGSPTIRRRLGKSMTTEQIKRAFFLTVRYGILARAYFIYAAAGETWQTIAESLDLIQEIKPLAAIFYILTLFPGTALYGQYQKKTGASDDIWLERMEDILYFETDPVLNRELVLEFGKALRSEYHRRLSLFARDIELIEDPEFKALHADFLSRLAMTFSHGDYARIQTVVEPAQTAEHLYRRALTYHADPRAFLGLGILCQQSGRLAESIDWLEQGLIHFPHSQPLTLCLGVSLMNDRKFKLALACFERFPDSKEARRYHALCREAIWASDTAFGH
jgi:tetratricopeptide (TPR) repeat protein